MHTTRVHPWVFLVLILPYGVMTGFLSVTVTWQLTQGGVSVEQTAALVATGLAPHVWKFLWAPLADTTLTPRRWYLIASLVSSLGLFLMGAAPATAESLPALGVIVFAANIASTFLGMAVESLMAGETPPDEKGRAGGWFQAGSLGGAGIGGGAALWLAEQGGPHWLPGAALAASTLPCALALLLVPDHAPTHVPGRLGAELRGVFRDLLTVARSHGGALALVLCFLPLGAGAASELWSPVAGEWHASARTVGTVTGVLGGIVSALGCVVGGWICDRTPRMATYAGYGVLQALCAVAMAASPHSEPSYVLYTLLYAFITGLCFAGFSAFVLEVMGTGAAATKYNAFASLANVPIYYMTRLDGWAHDRWGASGMLYGEAVAGMLGLVGFLVAARVLPRSSVGDEPAAP